MSHTKDLSIAREPLLITNPWLWMSVGLVCCAAAFLWLIAAGGSAVPRVFLIVAGLIAAGSAVARRLNSSRESYLDGLPVRRKGVLVLLALVHAGLAIGVVVLFAVGMSADTPWNALTLGIICLLVVPSAGAVSFFCFDSASSDRAFGKAKESAALLVLSALCAFLSGWSLYAGVQNAESWDSIRTFLAVLASVALFGAMLVLLPTFARRAIVSILIIFHFCGILTAILSVSPMPWMIGQMRQRIFRPYLQFMFLENAYQFYAPNPGPSNYFWFRIDYENAKKEKHWRWVKFPQLDKSGIPDYPFGIQYQRRIAMVDQMAIPDAVSQPWFTTDNDNNQIINPIYYWRVIYSTKAPHQVLGQAQPQNQVLDESLIPLHPDVTPWTTQYRVPSYNSKKLIESAAKHVAQWPHPDHPKDKVVSVKAYHAIHKWLTPQTLRQYRVSPVHPALYHPYYQGKYNPDGKPLDEPKFDPSGNLLSGDPFLHWLIPILVDNPANPNHTIIRGFVFKHAGDNKWIMYEGKDYWQEDQRRNPVIGGDNNLLPGQPQPKTDDKKKKQ